MRSLGTTHAEFKRDWGGLRRYFSTHRSREHDYVGRSLASLREAVQTFARCLATAVGEDRTSDDTVSQQLGKLTEAFRGNDAGSIRKEAENVASLVQAAISQRKQRQDAQFRGGDPGVREAVEELEINCSKP